MRLVKVAKALGMTGQELRHELTSVDFGVKATDREVPDNLAQGILRYVSRKKGIEVDMVALGFEETDATAEPGRDVKEENAVLETEEKQEETVTPAKPAETSVSTEGLKVLRKLTLDDVSQAAIAKEKRKLDASASSITKKEEKEVSEEDRAVDRATALRKKKKVEVQQQIKEKKGKIALPEQLTVKEFAEKAGVQVPRVMEALMKNGVMVTLNQFIDFDTAAIVADELHVEVEREEAKVDVENLLSRNLEELLKDEKENLQPRPPVVVVMGHVDHGKTSILDAVRQTDVVSGEAGGITQHIGAYQIVHVPKRSKEQYRITFLDTPGHEAFTAMRARGAHVTDIAIIVIAADEGIKPTTVEAINHAKEAGVPIIVALNKMDKEGADLDRVKGELAGYDLQPEEWGGSVPVVPCSAKSHEGIDTLLDTIVVVAEVQGFTANPDRSAVATVIESHLDPSLGALATVVVNTGTLRGGDAFVCGGAYGKVRAMIDAHGERLENIAPSGAARVSGFSGVPEVGDLLQVVQSEQAARAMVDAVRKISASRKKRSFADLVSRLSEGKLTQLKIVLKADTQGSSEAIQDALHKLATDEVSVKVIHAAVGGISENDVMMAAASDGVVIGFHTLVPSAVRQTAEREGVEVREYEVVYTLLDDVAGLLKGLVEPVEEEKIYGHLEVKEVFLTKKSEQIIGGKVTDGLLKRLPFRLLRSKKEVGTGRILSLRRGEKDAKEVKEGIECGMRVETSLPIEQGDVLEVYLCELKKKA